MGRKPESAVNFLHRSEPVFPPVERALDDPNGLLAVGGELTPEWLIAAYRQGIFPWFDDDDAPPLWWSPDPRTVLYPEAVKISRSLRKRLRNGGFEVTFDTAFDQVIRACAEPRRNSDGLLDDQDDAQDGGTWITGRMTYAYQELHDMGLAHSVEAWRRDDDGNRMLAGGLYGVSLGRMFFGESMFARQADASKVALCHLCERLTAWSFTLIDCQVGNPHLRSLGAVDLPRESFIRLIELNARETTLQGAWS